MTMQIDTSGNVHDIYHEYQPVFNKKNKSEINIEVFSNETYSHVRAVLISRFEQVLFPNLSHHNRIFYFDEVGNGFILIHNRFADFKLETGALPVRKEFIAEFKENRCFVRDVENSEF